MSEKSPLFIETVSYRTDPLGAAYTAARELRAALPAVGSKKMSRDRQGAETVKINPSALNQESFGIKVGGEVLEVKGLTEIAITRDVTVKHGTIDGVDHSNVVISVSKDGKRYAVNVTSALPMANFSVEHFAGTRHIAVPITADGEDCLAIPNPNPQISEPVLGQGQITNPQEFRGVKIDNIIFLAVYVTPPALRRNNGAVVGALQNSIANARTALVNSGVNAMFIYRGTHELNDINESANPETILRQFRDHSGAEQIRKNVRGDIKVLVVDELPGINGMAFVGGSRELIMDVTGANGGTTLFHEIEHTFGGSHHDGPGPNRGYLRQGEYCTVLGIPNATTPRILQCSRNDGQFGDADSNMVGLLHTAIPAAAAFEAAAPADFLERTRILIPFVSVGRG